MHPKNPHIDGYDMQALAKASPALKSHIIESKHGRETINFSNVNAVKALNQALLVCHYDLDYWDIPKGHLCPPIPGRADYLLGLNDALISHNSKFNLDVSAINALDIGTGANLIYPIIGQSLLNWNWVGSDIDLGSINHGQSIVDKNSGMADKIHLRHQSNSDHIFTGIVQSDDYFNVTCCNPPFHKSAEEALAGSVRKNKNLAKNKSKRNSNVKHTSSNQHLNFEGQSNELWCKGGEVAFIKTMISESRNVAEQVGLFSCLVSKKDNLPAIAAALKSSKVCDFEVHEMQQGSKVSRFITWCY